MKLHYEIERNGKTPQKLSGGTDIAGALCVLLHSAEILEGCSGTITNEAADAVLLLEADRDLGVYLCLTNKEGTYLSLRDPDDLAETAARGGEERLIARGLFIAHEDACKAIRAFAADGKPAASLQWTAPEELPEETAYIIE